VGFPKTFSRSQFRTERAYEMACPEFMVKVRKATKRSPATEANEGVCSFRISPWWLRLLANRVSIGESP
jgi:hypothetical protein